MAVPGHPLSTLERMAVESTGNPFSKWWHYFAIYDRLLGAVAERSRRGILERPLRILEIGVDRGGSIDLWRHYFGESAVIYGIDVNPHCASLDVAGEIRIGSQTDQDFLRSVVAEMGGIDIVIDDGSHVSSHVIASLTALFPLLSEDGRYIIEDLHTSYWPEWGGGLRRRNTSIEFLKRLVDVLNQPYFGARVTKGATGIDHASLLSVEFFDSVAVLTKRSNRPPELFHGGQSQRTK